MRLQLTAALLTLAGGLAHAQTPAGPCSPSDFAKGRCDTLEAPASAVPQPTPTTAASGQQLRLTLDPSLESGGDDGLRIDRTGQEAFQRAAIASRRQDASGPPPGGVPSIRPASRPAVVVPLIRF